MPTIRERFQKQPAIIQPFAIIEGNGIDAFVIEAKQMAIDRDGRLMFTVDGAMVGAVETGQWQRVVRGITLKELTGET